MKYFGIRDKCCTPENMVDCGLEGHVKCKECARMFEVKFSPYDKIKQNRGLIISMIGMIGVMFFIMYGNLHSSIAGSGFIYDMYNGQQTSIDGKIEAMSCSELKQYYETPNYYSIFSGFNNPNSGHAGTVYHQKDCMKYNGYLKDDEYVCSFTGWDYYWGHCTRQYPADWYWIDSSTGKKITDHAEYEKLTQGWLHL